MLTSNVRQLPTQSFVSVSQAYKLEPNESLMSFSGKQHDIGHYIGYSKLCPTHRTYALNLIALSEPGPYEEASANQHGVKAMRKEIEALEENNTRTISSLPYGKHAIDHK
ncbi:hypothetical protein Nepgr_026892 [Nepenthes gracilis]|uniref:Uncharacterized protein n=1 Tax=Nepenthes gracilis TaxID=150966 RepID=A0AAD3Y2J4_NEPGR|nr:hypothetical protein Nepgr_026892 [Nepenthes gracilis]